jgi:hypothetical protein
MHNFNMEGALNHVQRIRMLRILTVAKRIDSQSMITSTGSVVMPAIPLRNAQSGPDSLVICDTVNKKL